MSLGSVQTIIICVVSTTQDSLCPAGMGLGTIQAYVVDATQASLFDSLAQPFDYFFASGLWSISFSFVLGLYFVSKGIGVILEFIRRS